MFRVLVVVGLASCGRFSFDPHEQADAPLEARGIVELSYRGDAACVRSADGRVACWGSNSTGQLGNGTTSPNGPPQLVSGLPEIVSIAAGEFTIFAIDRDGGVWGWGANDEGQLGLAPAVQQQLTAIQLPIPEPIASIAAGQYHTCAITRGLGELYCWGGNQCGQLGTGDQIAVPSPRKVPNVSGVARVAVNDRQTCFLDGTSNLYCMGAAYVSAGCQNVRLAPVPPVGLPAAIDLAGGCHEAMCAVDPSGAAWCWGDNVGGVLGDGTVTPRIEPSRVAIISNVARVTAGVEVSCAASVSGEVQCWGANYRGGLGIDNMSVTSSVVPVQVPFFTGQPVDQIETGCTATCLRSGAEIYCWGGNSATIIDSSAANAYAPVLRGGLPF